MNGINSQGRSEEKAGGKKIEERGEKGEMGRERRGESVDKVLKPPLSPLIINLSLICQQHVMKLKKCTASTCQITVSYSTK